MTTYANRSENDWDGAIFALAAIAAALTSIVNCIMTGKWVLLVVDLLVAPVAVLHGFMVWFGVG